jgi:hypothetical protein
MPFLICTRESSIRARDNMAHRSLILTSDTAGENFILEFAAQSKYISLLVKQTMGSSRSHIRWSRVACAALASEIVPILSLFLIVAIYSFLASPNGTPDDARLTEFAQKAGFIVGPVLGSLVTFGCSYLACRTLRSRFITHGALIGLFSTAIGVSLLLMLGEGFSWIFAGSYFLRFSSAVGGSIFAEWKKPVNIAHRHAVGGIESMTKERTYHPGDG